MTAKWIIHQMDTLNDGTVVAVRYRVEGPDMQNYQCYAEEMRFERSSEGFVPYNDLTEDTVLGWIRSRLGEPGVQYIEALVSEKLPYIPSLESPKLPWAET